MKDFKSGKEWFWGEFQSSDILLMGLLVFLLGLAMVFGPDNEFLQDLIKMAMGGILVYLQKDAERR